MASPVFVKPEGKAKKSTLFSDLRKGISIVIACAVILVCAEVPLDNLDLGYLCGLAAFSIIVYFAVRWDAFDEGIDKIWERTRNRHAQALLTASLAGSLANVATQIVLFRHHYTALDQGILAWDSVMMFAASPLPYCPGRLIFFRLGGASRFAIAVMLVVVSAWCGRFGIMFPALYILVTVTRKSSIEMEPGRWVDHSLVGLNAMWALGLAAGTLGAAYAH